MTAEKPPVLRSAWNAYADSSRAVAAMPAVTSIAIAIGMFYGILDYAAGNLVGTDLEKGFGPALAGTAIGAVANFVLTPFFIAVHRFIVLGETTNHYVLRPGDPRFLKFFGWTRSCRCLSWSRACSFRSPARTQAKSCWP